MTASIAIEGFVRPPSPLPSAIFLRAPAPLFRRLASSLPRERAEVALVRRRFSTVPRVRS